MFKLNLGILGKKITPPENSSVDSNLYFMTNYKSPVGDFQYLFFYLKIPKKNEQLPLIIIPFF